MRKSREQAVQNGWHNLGLGFHSLHRFLKPSAWPLKNFPTFYYDLTHRLSQSVHKISAELTDLTRHFSADSTGPITTITTFIYKNIEKEAF